MAVSQQYIQVTIRIDPGEEDEGGFVALSPELGVASQGETIDEVLKNIHAAVLEFLEGLADLGDLDAFIKQRGIEVYDQLPIKPSNVAVNRGEVVALLTAAFSGKTAALA